ncbi:MAG: MBL fold metallo-hydrolase [Solirubrobacteraceae bacterium]
MSVDVRAYATGAIQENCYIVSASAHAHAAIIVDPGDEAERLLAAAAALDVELAAILHTHTHFDHVGAVAPIARESGAPVYCPAIERPILEDINRWVPPGFGPFESFTPQHTLSGGETLQLADLHIEVISTPGHSPGHLTYAISAAEADAAAADATAHSSSPSQGTHALLSGDVLFQGSVGRVDLPRGDWPTLQRSIATLIQRFPPHTPVYPGHLGVTTLGRELQTNPFLTEIRAASTVPVQRGQQPPAQPA